MMVIEFHISANLLSLCSVLYCLYNYVKILRHLPGTRSAIVVLCMDTPEWASVITGLDYWTLISMH